MAILQAGFTQIKREYIFPIIEKKVLECQNKDLLNLGIGDVSLPLATPIAKAIHEAISEMQEKIIGYPSSFGDYALREKIHTLYYKKYHLAVDDIFISDGINSDLGDLQELFDPKASFGVADPTYPVPLDVCIMAGKDPHILPTSEETLFLPKPPSYPLDVVYLCTPNNPSGTAMDRALLEEWIAWALTHKAILIIDQAYSDFIDDSSVPSSIYELEGAERVAIELRSFSKSAGFTGLRCSYSIVPSTIEGTLNGKTQALRPLWAKRMATKSNGVSYPIQKGALAALTEEGHLATQNQVHHYKRMAKTLYTELKTMGYSVMGGIHAPYVFVKCPPGFSSWSYFDHLLEKAALICVPGCGFGKQGEGYIRLSGFITQSVCQRALERFEDLKAFV